MPKFPHSNINLIQRNSAMGDDLKQFMKRLENRTYRCLQQTAKSLGLPSNYKKVYLIELIHAKKFRSEEDVETIINKVKLERCFAAKNKRDRSKKIKCSNLTRENNKSPSITVTPKRHTVHLPFSTEERRAIMSFNSKRSLLRDIDHQIVNPRYKGNCDRVLRSFNLKSFKTQNYNITMNSLNESNKNNNSLRSKAIVKINTKEGNLPNYYVSSKCFVKKHKPGILNINNSTYKKPLILRQKDLERKTYMAVQEHNTVSGIYPIVPYRTSKIVQTPGTSVCLVRKNDGSLTKINAFIQNQYNIENKQNNDINIQEIISCIEQSAPEDKALHKSPMHPVSVIERFGSLSTQDTFTQTENNHICGGTTDGCIEYGYYHERLEEMKYKKCREQDQRLPNINDVFTRFNKVKNVTQPIFVHVTAEYQANETRPFYTQGNCNTVMLEGLYNFKNYMLPNNSLLQIASRDNTKCIYTTPIMTMATAHQPASIGTGHYNCNMYEQDNRYTSDRDPSMYEFLQYPKQQHHHQRHDDYNRSSSSTDTYQGRATPATIPEMVEDALEIISQDGDYMERIAMETRAACAACVVCPWAGPADVLRHHIEAEHSEQVVEARGGEWRVSWTLGALARARRAHVLRHHASLYVLSAHYRDPERLAATLTSVSMDPEPKVGVITVYNKLTGQPYTWSGYVEQACGGDEPRGLRVDISGLDLLPNSANVRILNRELVTDSAPNVVLGPPALNDIHIVMYVKII